MPTCHVLAGGSRRNSSLLRRNFAAFQLRTYRDEWAIAPACKRSEYVGMKRIAAAPLWFLVGWFVGSVVSWTLGLGPILAPVAALAFATFVVADPLRLIWDRNAVVRTRSIARLNATTDAHLS
jgi:hypothetical protein